MSKGDLISREALKKEVTERVNFTTVDGHIAYDKTLELIDNAPTVEPQDRWGRWVISEVRCPKCLTYFDTGCYLTGELNKCPSCGANLKGGAE